MTQKSNPHQHSANESDIVTRTKDKQKMKKKTIPYTMMPGY